jgi:tRNA threonylcarbamoyladenosine biosynthesis protein TsaE
VSSTEHLAYIVESADEATTARTAQRLAQCAGLQYASITLHGDLGAGKTTWVRYLLRALGVAGRIKSPTYAVLESYEAPAAPHWPQGLAVSHFDFYRFTDPREWIDAGFRELFAAPGLKLVEWPEKAQGTLPTPDLSLHLQALPDDHRRMTFQSHTKAGAALLQRLKEAPLAAP